MELCGSVIAVREVQNSLYPSVIVEYHTEKKLPESLENLFFRFIIIFSKYFFFNYLRTIRTFC